MNNHGFSGLKIAVIFILFTGFLFVLVEQRLESREYEKTARDIQKNIENLNAQKMELKLGIDAELQRLSSYDYSSIGKPITMRDVIIVPVENPSVQKPENPPVEPGLNIFDRLLSRLLNLF
jgi:hypothetical protein